MRKKRLFILTGLTVSLIMMIWAFFPLDQDQLYKPPSQAIYADDGKLLRAFLSSDEKWRMPCRLDEVSPHLKKAVITVEDRCFYYHPGINP